MQYRIDNKSGNKLSVLGFGCMRLPRGLNMKPDFEKSEKLILSAIEKGVNYFDTAYLYAGSEEALGRVLSKNGVRDKVYVATKLPYQKCRAYEDFDRLFNMQLSHLQTDYVDYYLIHNLSDKAQWDSLREMGVERWIEAKKQSGQIRRIGFSFHGAQNGFLELLDAYEWDFCQIQYNYMNENYQAGRTGLLAAAKKSLPVIVMEPLLGGKLATGLPKKAEAFFREANAGRSPAEWALRWLWNQPEVTVVLSGMNAQEQLDGNLKAAESAEAGMTTPREAEAIGAVRKVFDEAYKIPCTGCNYCMPCPHGVNIPGCFASYNASYVTGYISGLTLYLTSTGVNHPEKNYSARRCVACGQCEKRCPQHIEIIKGLKSVSKRMEPAWLRPVIKIVGRTAQKPE